MITPTIVTDPPVPSAILSLDGPCKRPDCDIDHLRLIPLDDLGLDDLAEQPAPPAMNCLWREGGYNTCNQLVAAPGYVFCKKHIAIGALSEAQR